MTARCYYCFRSFSERELRNPHDLFGDITSVTTNENHGILSGSIVVSVISRHLSCDTYIHANIIHLFHVTILVLQSAVVHACSIDGVCFVFVFCFRRGSHPSCSSGSSCRTKHNDGRNIYVNIYQVCSSSSSVSRDVHITHVSQ